ncbi:MAG: PHP domain-containing protein [Sweet potato little leaf phytoplasma]|uniref:exonuclease domain-containing protein n=1 Tax=Candidatus Phytoplasma australasiaticum TaxID=2754999 RepID=UPI00210D0F93|nr:exonuclease domain-containing protein [Sweet potato little leaf phytoplasma]MDV3201553.1 PHP domain-containing protein [Candidatus Phytoplasma australasiaticum]MDO7987030.1 PHP domain-containing protein [Sweet potato little leaf phytoplasma]MDO8005276.1 PHP domain-containing protein [Sweet potato little leaf phytoplasma]MDO8008635.1 PHP domain-containing protein [Sweet potato little leaf phytoplasma]MDO8020248.1 PHP domain-containing protein [Sweet potato little leaf phytoplasma]
MKLYSKFIKFIKNKNIRNFPLIEVVVDDKQMNSWDCFFQIEEYPEETTHFECFEKEFQNFFLKPLSEDLENFVQLQPLINVHFRILDWNLLKDDYIWKKHYQYMLDKIITNSGIDIDKKLIFFFQNTPILDLNTKKCLFKRENKIEEIFDISELKLKMHQLQKLFIKFYNFNFDFEFLQFDKDVISEKTVHQYKYFSNNLSKNNKNIPLFNFQDIPIVYDEMFLFYKKFPQIIIQGYIQFVIDHDKYGTFWISFYLVDPISCQDSILVKKFLSKDIKKAKRERDDLINVLREGILISAVIEIKPSKPIKDKVKSFYFNLKDYKILDKSSIFFKKTDDYIGKKRIEFHIHTKMSNLDAITSAKDYIELAEKWGHEAITFTDHDGLYAFPEIYKYIYNKNIKVILGVELDFIEEKPIFITNQEINLNKFSDFVLKNHNYVVLDIETTGFSKTRDRIISIAAVKIQNGKIIEYFDELINPGKDIKISNLIQRLTNISDEILLNKPHIKEILSKFLDFIRDCPNCVLVAHNASFDIEFLQETFKNIGLYWPLLPVIDTLTLAQKYFNKILKYFSLEKIVKSFKIKLDSEGQYHNALFDARATALIFLEMLEQLEAQKIFNFYDLQGSLDIKFERPYHVNIIVKNKKGYNNLFHLISDALTRDFIKKPRLLKSNFEKYREGLLIGSGCFDSNVFNIALYKNNYDLAKAISYYDYIEVQPPQAYRHIIYDLNGDSDFDIDNSYGLSIIKDTIIKIIKEAQRQNKIIIATGDVHYLYPYEKILREVYINAKLIGGGLHRLSKYPSKFLPDNYFLTTQEMLDSFNFISDEKLKKDLVINNTHLLNQQIEKFKFFSDQLFNIPDDMFVKNLKISSIRSEILNIVNEKILNLYGKLLHPIIKYRIEQELSVIAPKDNLENNNIVAIYYLSYLLVKKSTEDGYPVGSRGSVGASLIANILGITEINPLPPHYRCVVCKYTIMKTSITETLTSEYQNYLQSWPFVIDIQQYQKKFKTIFSGYDLPKESCPFCNQPFVKDGQDIPFETFLGFDGNKKPDIDLNFSGDYQNQIHNYLRELLGENCVFRAGTIQTVAKQNAYGYIKSFMEEKQIIIRDNERDRRVIMIEGVKRSTGQHPGGIVIIPSGLSIYDVTPIQFPANDVSSEWKTTHFDYHALEKNLFKLDILGHDDPTLIKFLMDDVLKNPSEFPFSRFQDIPVDDNLVYEIFANKEECKTSQAIPEFGTPFVRNMLNEIYLKEKKFNFSTLVKVSGLSHGTGVWSGNAQDQLKDNKSIFDLITCRDDILNYLISKGLKKLISFEIMELVRKGKQNNDRQKWSALSKIMREHNVNDWYIESLQKIQYLFPKPHAAAYVLMALRIAWFKVHAPLLFYKGYFSTRVSQFDYENMMLTTDKIAQILQKSNEKDMKTVQKEKLHTLKIAKEMKDRGYNFLPIDLNKSEANLFVMEVSSNSLIMPFITIDGLGQVGANNIVKARGEKLFTQQDFEKRVKLNKTILKKFHDLNLIQQLPLE